MKSSIKLFGPDHKPRGIITHTEVNGCLLTRASNGNWVTYDLEKWHKAPVDLIAPFTVDGRNFIFTNTIEELIDGVYTPLNQTVATSDKFYIHASTETHVVFGKVNAFPIYVFDGETVVEVERGPKTMPNKYYNSVFADDGGFCFIIDNGIARYDIKQNKFELFKRPVEEHYRSFELTFSYYRGTYYAYSINKRTCYSSKDLVEWETHDTSVLFTHGAFMFACASGLVFRTTSKPSYIKEIKRSSRDVIYAYIIVNPHTFKTDNTLTKQINERQVHSIWRYEGKLAVHYHPYLDRSHDNHFANYTLIIHHNDGWYVSVERQVDLSESPTCCYGFMANGRSYMYLVNHEFSSNAIISPIIFTKPEDDNSQFYSSDYHIQRTSFVYSDIVLVGNRLYIEYDREYAFNFIEYIDLDKNELMFETLDNSDYVNAVKSTETFHILNTKDELIYLGTSEFFYRENGRWKECSLYKEKTVSLFDNKWLYVPITIEGETQHKFPVSFDTVAELVAYINQDMKNAHLVSSEYTGAVMLIRNAPSVLYVATLKGNAQNKKTSHTYYANMLDGSDWIEVKSDPTQIRATHIKNGVRYQQCKSERFVSNNREYIGVDIMQSTDGWVWTDVKHKDGSLVVLDGTYNHVEILNTEHDLFVVELSNYPDNNLELHERLSVYRLDVDGGSDAIEIPENLKNLKSFGDFDVTHHVVGDTFAILVSGENSCDDSLVVSKLICVNKDGMELVDVNYDGLFNWGVTSSSCRNREYLTGHPFSVIYMSNGTEWSYGFLTIED